ncbi:hypothetical protein D3C84_1139350 [compost metagenome]
MLMALLLTLTIGLQLLNGCQVRVQMQLALVGVEQHWGAVGQRQHLNGQPADRRQTGRPREDCDVAGSAATDRGEPQNLASIEPGGL